MKYLLLEQDDESLVDVYQTNRPSGYSFTTDHNKAINDPELQDWKVRNKKFFLENADHEWFNNTFVFVHWLGHSAMITYEMERQLDGILSRMNPGWQRNNLSAMGYSREKADTLFEHKRPSIGLVLDVQRFGYAAMTDMWTEEHSTLKHIDGHNTIRKYKERYDGAKIPKRPGWFDPTLAFSNDSEWKDILASPKFKGNPNIIPEVICDRWKLKEILVPVDFGRKEQVINVLEAHNYDVDTIIKEY